MLVLVPHDAMAVVGKTLSWLHPPAYGAIEAGRMCHLDYRDELMAEMGDGDLVISAIPQEYLLTDYSKKAM